MRTFALLFAFVPVFLAYIPNGDLSGAPVFWTLLLIYAAVEICDCLAEKTNAESSDEIIYGYSLEIARAVYAKDHPGVKQAMNAKKLFVNRGAA